MFEGPDGGYGWFVVVGSFMTHFIVLGSQYSAGVFVRALTYELDVEQGAASWATSVAVGCMLGGGLVSGPLVHAYGPRLVGLFGASLSALGMLLASFSGYVWQATLAYGVVCGAGFSCYLVPSTVVITYYFHTQRALAVGLGVAGSGIGTLALSPVATALVLYGGYPLAFRVFAVLQLCIGGFAAMAYVPVRLVRWKAAEDSSGARGYPEDTRRMAPFAASEAPGTTSLPAYGSSIGTISRARSTDPEHSKADARASGPDGGAGAGGIRCSPDGKPTETSTAADDDIEHYCCVPLAACNPILDWQLAWEDDENEATDAGSSLEGIGRQRGGEYSALEDDGNVIARLTEVESAAGQVPASGNSTRAFVSGPATSAPKGRSPSPATASNGSTNRSRSRRPRPPAVTICDLWATRDFAQFALAIGVSSFGYFVPFTHLVAFLQDERGFSPERAAFAVSVIGIASTAGRVLLGKLADLPCLPPVLMFVAALMLTGIPTALLPVTKGDAALFVYSALYGLGSGTFVAVTPIAAVTIVGVHAMPLAMGQLYAIQCIPTLLGPPVTGWMRDGSGDFTQSFVTAGSALVGGSLLLLGSKCRTRADGPAVLGGPADAIAKLSVDSDEAVVAISSGEKAADCIEVEAYAGPGRISPASSAPAPVARQGHSTAAELA